MFRGNRGNRRTNNAVGAGLLGLGLGLATAAVLTTPSRSTVTVSHRGNTTTFWHGSAPRWLPSGFVVSSNYHNNRGNWVNQAQTLFYQNTMGLNYLTKKTFKRALMCLGVHKHQSKHLFFMMDVNRDGVISLDEFINAYLFVMSGGLAYKGTGFSGMGGIAYPTTFALQPNQSVTVTTTQYQQPPPPTTYQQVTTYASQQPMYQPPPQQPMYQPQPSQSYYQPPQQQTSYYQPQQQPQGYNQQPYGQPQGYNTNTMPPSQPYAQTTTTSYQPPQPPMYQPHQQQPRYY